MRGSMGNAWRRMLRTMGALVAAGLLAGMMAAEAAVARQEGSGKGSAVKEEEAPAARSKSGKKLFSAADALRVERVTSPRISPDGTRVAYLVAANEMEKDKPGKFVTHVWVVPAAGPATAARQYTRGEKSASGLEWSPDGKMIGFVMDAGEEKEAKPQVWFMYVDGGEAWQVTKHKAGVRGFQFSPDGKTLLLTATAATAEDEEKRTKVKDDARVVDHDYRMAQLWTWNIATGEEKELTKGDATVSDARFSPDGTRVTFTTNPTPRQDDASLSTAWVMDVASGAKHKVAEMADPTHTARWSPEGKRIAFLSSSGPLIYKVNLFVVDANGGGAKKVTGSFELNAGEPYWSKDGAQIYFSTDDHEAMRIFAADLASGTARPLTDATRMAALAEISDDGKTAVGMTGDPTHPEDVFRSDLNFGTLEKITNQNAWLAEYALGETEVVKWKSSKDGMEIDGIVTKPVDWDGVKKTPFLLNPHGGPTGASLLSFSPTEQVMAANGYMVLQPNFRGSSGRGEKFATANENDWGGGDYKDDMSGVQALVDKGWADPERMGAFGWSYGGYMTMWIDTQTDRFKAISPGAGLPDLVSMYAETDIHRYLTVFEGMKPPSENYQEYWDHSPMKFIGNVKTPTMILHGQADTRVPIPQAEEFYQGLSDRKVPVEYVTYPRENHGFVEPRHIQDRLQRYLVFFGKYLNNPPVTEPKGVVERMSKDLPQ
ncbi:MAG TPA: S9 family peptidase [Candidatus Methylomirabilis sp.]|nr:S9 family peptidase [Candidatus Methylomirabilis sp.]